MADSKITALTAISTVDPTADPLVIVDVSDTSMAASGTTKKSTINQLLGSGGTATLASATITGDLTVGNATNANVIFNGVTNVLNIGFGSLRGGAAYGDVRLWTDRFRIYNNAGTQIIKNISGTNGDETWYDGAGGTRMTLNSTGLGIGQNASDKFNVRVTPASSSFGGMTVNDATNAVGLFITGSAYSSFGVGANSGWVYSATNNLAIGPYGSGYVSIVSNGSERMRVTSTGNVGIGVTPTSLLHISGASPLFNIQSNSSTVATTASLVFTMSTVSTSKGAEIIAERTGAGAASALRFHTNDTLGISNERMRITDTGNVLVGTTSSGGVNGFSVVPDPSVPTCVLNGSATTGGTAYLVYSAGATANRFYVTYAGTVFATNTTISAISDARFKENVQDIDIGLGAILALKPRKFDWKAGKGKDIKGDRGFIAQEFEQVFPQLVDEWADPAPEGEAPYKSVRQDLIPVLVKAIQELTARVQTLEAK